MRGRYPLQNLTTSHPWLLLKNFTKAHRLRHEPLTLFWSCFWEFYDLHFFVLLPLSFYIFLLGCWTTCLGLLSLCLWWVGWGLSWNDWMASGGKSLFPLAGAPDINNWMSLLLGLLNVSKKMRRCQDMF